MKKFIKQIITSLSLAGLMTTSWGHKVRAQNTGKIQQSMEELEQLVPITGTVGIFFSEFELDHSLKIPDTSKGIYKDKTFDKVPLPFKILPSLTDVSFLQTADGKTNRARLEDSQRRNLKENFPRQEVSIKAKDLLIEHSDTGDRISPNLISSQTKESLVETSIELPINKTQLTQANNENAQSSSSQADLAKQSQNPIANLISVPFQNSTNFGVGEFDRTSNIMNIQPVLPTSISEDWLLINRTIIPVAYQPELAPNVGNVFGLGAITYQGFFSPKGSGNFTWGIGPTVVLPTTTDTVLGSDKWSIGPSAIGLVTTDRIVTGALVSNVWSFVGKSDRSDVSLLTIQPFFNYNFDDGWYVTTSPIITANWLGTGEKWTLPIGGGFGRVFKIGNQPVNMQLQGFWNVVKPEGAADWTLRIQMTLLFPK